VGKTKGSVVSKHSKARSERGEGGTIQVVGLTGQGNCEGIEDFSGSRGEEESLARMIILSTEIQINKCGN
jgi:hypothetical protein